LTAPVAAEGPDPRSGAAVVFIRAIGDARIDFTNPLMQPIGQQDVEIGTGTGFVIAASGLILTNHHVVSGETSMTWVAGEAARVTTTVKRLEAVVGTAESPETFTPVVAATDAQLDLAALQVTTADLPYLAFGDSDAVEPGRPVSVRGFPFGRRVEVGKQARPDVVPEPTVTLGSLSAARQDDAGQVRYLQTDASMNPGSSGGPMVDEDGYVVGVVRMKLAPSRTEAGAGFGVPINLVKDFLDAHGLLSLLPSTRLRAGAVLASDWKGLHVELPDGFADASPARLRVDAVNAAGISVRVDRVATPWPAAQLEEAALQGREIAGFVPTAAAPVRQLERGEPARRVGSARGTTRNGRPFRVEYAVLELKGEKVVARYLGPPDELAFNLGLVRRSLETLSAEPLLTSEVRGPIPATFETVSSPDARTGSVLLPVGWSREPARHTSCPQLPEADAGLAASPPGDFTVVFRSLRWTRPGTTPEAMARTCGGTTGTTGSSYARGLQRLGVPIGAWGVFTTEGEEVLGFEAEAPEAKLPFVRDVFAAWVRASTGS
jgi:S1-C subfamily serine protease